LHSEPSGGTHSRAHSPALDGPEFKFRFGRYLERGGGPAIFDAPLRR
jgi:hypothetical protein